ncbi:MAG: ATP-binding protein [Caldilineales bacterium]|nr:ATP-binding protein [Caldilineales bacterium]MDW8318089.1 ATP-binding protein [Anaerolineae bacterium]
MSTGEAFPAQLSNPSGGRSAPAWSDELDALLAEVRNNTIGLGLIGLYLAGAAVLLAGPGIREPAQNLTLLLLVAVGPLAWSLRHRSFSAAAWLLIGASLALVFAIVAWGGAPAALALLALPVGLTTAAISRTAGLGLGVACSLLLWWAPREWLPADGVLRTVALLGVWGIVGLIWLTLEPLVTAMRWAWSGYESSQAALEQARETQVQLKRALEDLTAANAQLTRLNQLAQAMRRAAEEERRAKEQFVANVSHELRTPLNMIIGFSEMITQSPQTYGQPLPPALLADLKVILRNSQHLSKLIDDVLDLSQIDAGQMALTREQMALGEIIEAAAVAVRPLYASKGLSLEIEVAEDLPPVFCDPTRVREVMLNLLSNAGRFTEKGGVRVRAWQAGEDVVVSVADTGPGIAPADQERLFQPFYQTDGSIRRRYGGTGLGLSISKSFVELHGGKMWVESEPGRGATFFFRLPIAPPTLPSSGVARWINPYVAFEPRGRPPSFRPSPVRPQLLVVEQGNVLQRLLARYVENAEVVAVPSLEAALQRLSQTPARALLVNDLRAGEALERLLASAALPFGTPAIFCALPGLKEAIGALGVADYLVKPISASALLATLDRLERPVRTILIADDEPDALQLFRRMLASSGRGYRVLRAGDGKQAWDLLRHERPDVLLLDLVMPEMDGFQLLAAKSQEPDLRDIPVILISAQDALGHPIASNSLMATRGGGLSAQQLLACINALLGVLAPLPPSQPTGNGDER